MKPGREARRGTEAGNGGQTKNEKCCGIVRGISSVKGWKRMKRRILWKLLLAAVFLCLAVPAPDAQAAEPVVIVIDPGHGGENRGGEVEGQFLEKEITLQTALSMKQTLEQFEGAEVYLTRTGDQELSLEQRAQIAKAYDADFLFSLHYNMSSSHNLYGSEVWTSAFGESFAAGQTFAGLQLAEMAGNGQYIRGAKTRLNSRGTDYYGVIRESRQLGIPCVIIEHCYMDHPVDSHQIDTSEEVSAMGVSDALAVAKYFRLKSPSLGLDYSGYSYAQIPAPQGTAAPDRTAPESVSLSVLSADPADGRAVLQLDARDSQSGILYYSWSLDGGMTWSMLMPFANLGSLTFTIEAPLVSGMPVLCRAYNGYDMYSECMAVIP